MNDLMLLKAIPKETVISKVFQLDDSISMEAASNEPYDIFNEFLLKFMKKTKTNICLILSE